MRGLCRRGNVEIEFTKQPGKRRAAVAFDRNFRPGMRRTETIGEREPVFGQRLAGLLRSIPGFCSQREQADVVRLEVEVGCHLREPGAGWRTQMCRRLNGHGENS